MTYMNAEMELVAFAAEDVLATSNEGGSEEVATTTGCGAGEDIVLPPITIPRG